MSINDDFEEFWSHYPRRVGKLAARRAYERARKTARCDEIIAGVMRYLLRMPDEEKFRPHPATWLNQGRWMDEDTPQPRRQSRRAAAIDWWEECKARHGGACSKRWDHDTRMQFEREGAAS